MQRKIQTFRAATMDEALELVRKELGQDAVVLESKSIPTRRMLPWPSTRQEVEIGAEVTPRVSSVRPITSVPSKDAPTPRVIRTLAEAMQPSACQLLDAIPELRLDLDDSSFNSLTRNLPTSYGPGRSNWASSASRDSQSAETNSGSADPATVQSLQDLLERLTHQSGASKQCDIPSELLSNYRRFVDQDVNESIAYELFMRLREHANSDLLKSPQSTLATLTVLVERELKCAPPIQPRRGCREVITMVGPTGVGKTTTIAKLAGNFQLHGGLRVGLITVDTYRVAAIDQLRTYADILQIPMRTATNPVELRAAVDELEDVDVVLIDTAGRSPRDERKMSELTELIRAVGPQHVMLVLSLTAGGTSLAKIAEPFAAVRPTSLVITKLDEAQGCGGLLSIARQLSYPIRYLTTGQEVPDRIEQADPRRLARLIVGSDSIQEESHSNG